jgi:uncharacterized membrane-anchored protein YhcB (DUF1043 family)
LLPQLASTIKLKKGKKGCQKVEKSCQKVVKKLQKSCQKVVEKLSKSCQKVVKKLSKSCQIFVKNVCQKVVNNLPFCSDCPGKKKKEKNIGGS